MAQEEIIRRQYTFYGDVQGVGFRYRAQYAANACGVTGWVKNEWDGSVSMEAQGTPRAIGEMLRLLGEGKYIDILRMEQREIKVEEWERSFHIR